jgi:ABC-type branched-subunit amino acid transport system substrate-binding protein
MVAFRDSFQKLAGAPPRSSAVLAYDAANVLFAAIEQAVERDGRPTRAGVVRVLRDVQWTGLTGNIRFNERGESRATAAYLQRVIVGRYPGEPVATQRR